MEHPKSVPVPVPASSGAVAPQKPPAAPALRSLSEPEVAMVERTIAEVLSRVPILGTKGLPAAIVKALSVPLT